MKKKQQQRRLAIHRIDMRLRNILYISFVVYCKLLLVPNVCVFLSLWVNTQTQTSISQQSSFQPFLSTQYKQGYKNRKIKKLAIYFKGSGFHEHLFYFIV